MVDVVLDVLDECVMWIGGYFVEVEFLCEDGGDEVEGVVCEVGFGGVGELVEVFCELCEVGYYYVVEVFLF